VRIYFSLCMAVCVAAYPVFKSENIADLHVNCHELYFIDGHSYYVIFNFPISVTINMADVRISERQIH